VPGLDCRIAADGWKRFGGVCAIDYAVGFTIPESDRYQHQQDKEKEEGPDGFHRQQRDDVDHG
jgi:hypothetical protein